jgi:spore maturation protein CgeB
MEQISHLFSGLDIHQYDDTLDLDEALDSADLVIVHEWNSPDLIAQIGQRRARGAPFTLLFHDTHHRAVTAPDELAQFDLDGFDGVLAFGEVLRQIYLKLGWANRAFIWHEAADVALYRPMPEIEKTQDLVWIGNWGDGERSAELDEFLVRPVANLGLSASIHGVRYSDDALRAIQAAGIRYRGWLPAHLAPTAFASARSTVHVPRGPYARTLPGIPTIRMFEAMACGIPLVSAPWSDDEHLFPEGTYLRASNGSQMMQALRALIDDPDLSSSITEAGLRTIRERHTCGHRAQQLIEIVEDIRGPARAVRSRPQEGALA